MDSLGTLEQIARDLTTSKYMQVGPIALTLYDYLLMFDDEIRYIWKGRKTWTSYLYILNRILLIAYQFWVIYYLSNPGNSKTGCLVGYHVQVSLYAFFSLCSDIFITLRVYAITFKNKAVAVYFGTLMLARFATSLEAPFSKPPVFMDLPSIPIIDAFTLCAIAVDLKPMLVPTAIGTTFELSAFLAVVWYTYRNKNTLKFSALVRTIVTEATIYFLAIVAMQTYAQLSLGSTNGINQQLSLRTYGILNPILTMRFALSLRRSAAPDGGQEWQLKHLSSFRFASGPLPDTQVSAVYEDIEVDPVDPLNVQLSTCGP